MSADTDQIPLCDPNPDTNPGPIMLHLHGGLRRFGRSFSFHVTRPQAAIMALAAQCDGFAAALRVGHYHLWMDSGDTGSPRHRLRAQALYDPHPAAVLHLAPALAGAAKGDGKIMLGLTLLGLSFIPGVQAGISGAVGQAVGGTAGGELAGLFGSRLLGGAATWLILSGASDALAPQPRHPAGQTQSAAIGASQPSGEGAPIPLVYGRVRVTAPPVVSAGLRVTTIALS